MIRNFFKKIKRPFSVITILMTAVLTVVMGNVLIKKTIESRSSKASSSDKIRYLDIVFTSFSKNERIQFGQDLNRSGKMQGLGLTLYEPLGDTETMRPAIVWLHGGGFYRGSPTAGYVTDFVKRGYVVVDVRYRLAPDIKTRNRELKEWSASGYTILPRFLLDAQHDTLAAVRWLRANASEHRIDPNRIVVGGSSAGAIAALYAAYNYEDAGNGGNPGYSSKPSAVLAVMGGLYRNDPDNRIRSGDPPALFLIGDKDPFYQYALNTKAALERLSIPVVMTVFKDTGHLLKPGRTLNPLIAQFIYNQVVQKGIPSPSLPPSPHSPEPTPDSLPTLKPSPTLTPPGRPTPSPSSPKPIPDMPIPYDPKDVQSACYMLNRYSDIENYQGTAVENQKLQQLINWATKVGLNKIGVTNVTELLQFYNSYCK